MYPNIYDYGYYINSDKQWQFLFSSASWWQFYEMEYWFTDNWEDIDVELTSKELDFDDPSQAKTFDFVDFIWFKQQWWTIVANVYIDWSVTGSMDITDSHINPNATGALWISVLWVSSLWEEEWDTESDLQLYPFTVRVPFFARGYNIQWQLESNGVQWIIEKVRVNVNAEPVDVFDFSNIW